MGDFTEWLVDYDSPWSDDSNGMPIDIFGSLTRELRTKENCTDAHPKNGVLTQKWPVWATWGQTRSVVGHT